MTKKPPPSLHEKLVDQFRERDASDPEMDALSGALAACRAAAERALDTTEKILGNQLRTAEANAREARDVGHHLQQAALKRVDAARTRAQAEIDRIETSTSAPPEPRTASAVAVESEIRSALSRMSHDERAKAIADALERGDDSVVGAALRGPTMLTGLGEAEREARRHQWRQKKFPSELARLVRLRKSVEAMERGGSLLMNFVDGLTNSEAVRLAEASENLAREAAEAARA